MQRGCYGLGAQPRRQFGRTPFLIASQSERTERTRLMPTNTIRIHRVLQAAPEKIYRAFLDPDAMAKWLPPDRRSPNVECRMSKRSAITSACCFSRCNGNRDQL